MATTPLYLGIDFGTSGCRAVVIDDREQEIARAESTIPAAVIDGDRVSQDPQLWWRALVKCVRSLVQQCDAPRIRRMAIDGTSATVLLCDAQGQPVTPALMYNDTRAREQAGRIRQFAPPDSAATGASSSLAKVLWLVDHTHPVDHWRVQHQADWISSQLTRRFDHSDYHNALKLGFDVVQCRWPAWLAETGLDPAMLPQVVAPGTALGPVAPGPAHDLGLDTNTIVVAGTTDSIAAFLASGASEFGDAVTSLGSTLVLKLLSDTPVFAGEFGVYSHRLGERWLVGGASNSGGAVLRKYFSNEALQEMTPLLDPDHPTGLNYYPLPGPGERFPINDPDFVPRIDPVPDDPVRFFQGLLEGISHIEQRGYTLLAELGAPALKRVFTSGGGSHNAAWHRLRESLLGVPVLTARSADAAYGAALLARGPNR